MSQAVHPSPPPPAINSRWTRWFQWWIEHRVIAGLLCALLVGLGVWVAPWRGHDTAGWRAPIAVDAIPDIGEHQQIVFTPWPGRSPFDVEDQISYPLSQALLGTPGVKSVRSSSALGFSTIYVIFEEGTDFYWARSRLTEKLSTLSQDLLPSGALPQLGPDATALGQVFWYTLEGRDTKGQSTGGWDLDELRAVQDWTVRPALAGIQGVSEVASIGGFVREYQVNIDPLALQAHGVTLTQVADAVRKSNRDVGARTLELNRVEYLVRGLGRLESIEDLEATAVVAHEHRAVRIRDVAQVRLGPALRRGALDDEGAPAVGGVVVARYLEHPLEVIDAVKAGIARLQPGLPSKTLADGRRSQLTIVPFYDRSALIEETLDTVNFALTQEFLITLLVVVVMLGSLRAATLISLMLPLGVAGAFVAMKSFGVGANIMALGGIAIAIGTMVDIGIVFTENISRQLRECGEEPNKGRVVVRACAEVAPAVLTSVLTTIVSFLPVLGLEETELRLFAPLVWTKTFAMSASVLVALVLVPCAAYWLWARRNLEEATRGHRYRWSPWILMAAGLALGLWGTNWGYALALLGAVFVWGPAMSPWFAAHRDRLWLGALLLVVVLVLAQSWMPLGHRAGIGGNAVFVGLLFGLWLGLLRWFEGVYPTLLAWALAHKRRFAILPCAICALGLLAGVGVGPVVSRLPAAVQDWEVTQSIARSFPGLGRDYLPSFDEGAFLFMPTTMPHASMGQALEMLSEVDAAIAAIPEVDRVVGKIGRAETALDPAPLSMIETLITYHPEYTRNEAGELVRRWRDHIRSSQDIWNEITKAAKQPGLTGAPVLMPMSARIVMLQSGMRAPMGIRVQGPSLEAVQAFGHALEPVLREVSELRPDTVFAERVVAKPYLEIKIDRVAAARYGLSIDAIQEVIELGLGGKPLTSLIRGRERYPVAVRYMRETRDSVEAVSNLLVPVSDEEQIPLSAVAKLEYVRGPQVIKSQDAFLTSYVLFDRHPEVSLVDAVRAASRLIQERIAQGTLKVPPGVRFEFAGSYEAQQRSEQKMMLLVPVALIVILMLLQLQFRRISLGLMVFSAVAVAVSGGLILLWLYGQPWFLNVELGGWSLRHVFQVRPVNLSVAVGVGFIALLGLATDDGVVMLTYLEQRFTGGATQGDTAPSRDPSSIRRDVLAAAQRRVRPCLMTTATTVLALLPVVASQGRGADLMMPMALPCVGGMAVELVTLFVVPSLYCAVQERRLGQQNPPVAKHGG